MGAVQGVVGRHRGHRIGPNLPHNAGVITTPFSRKDAGLV